VEITQRSHNSDACSPPISSRGSWKPQADIENRMRTVLEDAQVVTLSDGQG
jgi:hypothetical protein